MGFTYRKSFKAGPFRATLSKSGVSYSVGGKAARVTKRADGRVQATVSAPGTGVRYTTSSTRRTTPASTAKPRTASRPRVPSRKEVEAGWAASRRPMPIYFPGMRGRKARFVAALAHLMARPDEATWLIVPVASAIPARDVLVVTSQRLLLFQADQVLRGGQIVGIDRAEVSQVTTVAQMLSTQLIICSGPDVEFCGEIAVGTLQWLRAITQVDPMFRLSA